MPQSANLLCREMSLLAFNRRVLAQAEDPRVPLLERLKFLCIVSSNLDEFFEVRMAWLKQQLRLSPHLPLANGELPQLVIHNVIAEIRNIITTQYQLFNQEILPALQTEGVRFYRRREWTAAQADWVEEYFLRELKPILTPIGLDSSHPFPRLMNKSLNFAVELDGKDAFGRESGMAIVQAPRILPRVVQLPPELCEGQYGFVFLSSIMHAHIDTLFSGMEVKGCHQFRVTRDSELAVDEEDLKNLRTAIQGELRDRQFGEAVRLEITHTCPEHVSDFLLEQFQLNTEAMYVVNGPVNLVRVMAVTDMVDRPDLKFPLFRPSIPKKLRQRERLFDNIAAQDALLHHPYQSFQPVVDMVRQAAKDPAVVAIKMTIYRTGSNSDLVKALLQAAIAGKQVTVVMELMARFDEENQCQLGQPVGACRRPRGVWCVWLQSPRQNGLGHTPRKRRVEILCPPRHRQLPPRYLTPLHRFGYFHRQRTNHPRREPIVHGNHRPRPTHSPEQIVPKPIHLAQNVAQQH